MTDKDTRWQAEWRGRLAELATWERGWWDGDGEAMPAGGYAWAKEALAPVLDALPGGSLCLTEQGNLSVGWHLDVWYPSVEIDLVTRRGDFHTCNVRVKGKEGLEAIETADLDLTTKDGKAELVRRVRWDMQRSEVVT